MTFQLLKTLQHSKFSLFKSKLLIRALGAVICGTAIFTGFALAGKQDHPVVFADQGSQWTPETRTLYYTQDQGSQLIPLLWLLALRQPDGSPFTADSLARYGYLPNTAEGRQMDLPAGFSVAASQQGPMAGITCAACHTRQISVEGTSYRIDGGPALADFQSFIVDLDEAVRRVLASSDMFKTFAVSVLGADAAKPERVNALHDAVAYWSLRFHTIVSRSVPTDRAWGPGRLDAISMIYNRLNGLDLGPPPTYMLPDNMAVGDAPVRSPFLWNAGRQDHTQWGGWAANGNEGLALARNLGQVIGTFATFHPNPKTAATPLDHDYLSANSANIPGLAMAEGILARLGPPVWPFPVDHDLAKKGQEIFNRSIANGGCADCHGIAAGEARGPNIQTWRTPVADAGTDLRQWQVVLRQAKSGTLEGAAVPGIAGPLKATDMSLNILKAVVTGTLVELQAAQAAAQAASQESRAKINAAPEQMAASSSPAGTMTHDDMVMTMNVPDMPPKMKEAPAEQAPAAPVAFGYEARVLQGIWAAAPYLHNGSVQSLSELLKPPAQRVKQFKVGPAYDTHTVGLASDQAAGFTFVATGCEDRNSGNSNCGHDYGTQLPADEKAALLEYLKTL